MLLIWNHVSPDISQIFPLHHTVGCMHVFAIRPVNERCLPHVRWSEVISTLKIGFVKIFPNSILISQPHFSHVLLFCRDADLSVSYRKTFPYPSPHAVNFPKGFLHFWPNSTWWNEVWTLLWETRSFQLTARNSEICGYNIGFSSGNWAWCSACSRVTVRSRGLKNCQWLRKSIISHLLRSPNIYGLLHTRLIVYSLVSQMDTVVKIKIGISLRFISNHPPIYASPKSTCCSLPCGFSYWTAVFVSSLYHAPHISGILALRNVVTP
jgi:hypothetical protein